MRRPIAAIARLRAGTGAEFVQVAAHSSFRCADRLSDGYRVLGRLLPVGVDDRLPGGAAASSRLDAITGARANALPSISRSVVVAAIVTAMRVAVRAAGFSGSLFARGFVLDLRLVVNRGARAARAARDAPVQLVVGL